MPCPARRRHRKSPTRTNSILPFPRRFAIGALPNRSLAFRHRSSDARVAQLVEHVIEDHGVGGSIPSPGTIFLR